MAMAMAMATAVATATAMAKQILMSIIQMKEQLIRGLIWLSQA